MRRRIGNFMKNIKMFLVNFSQIVVNLSVLRGRGLGSIRNIRMIFSYIVDKNSNSGASVPIERLNSITPYL